MKTPIPSSSSQGQPSGFDSRDTEIIYSDGPSDTTVRQCRPELLKWAMAEREKLARWGDWKNQSSSTEQPTDPNNEDAVGQ